MPCLSSIFPTTPMGFVTSEALGAYGIVHTSWHWSRQSARDVVANFAATKHHVCSPIKHSLQLMWSKTDTAQKANGCMTTNRLKVKPFTFAQVVHYLHHNGSLSTRMKGHIWKGPFHMPRMMLYCWQLPDGRPKPLQPVA